LLEGQIGAKSYLKGDYGNMPACGARENKAKQSQFKANRRPLAGNPEEQMAKQ